MFDDLFDKSEIINIDIYYRRDGLAWIVYNDEEFETLKERKAISEEDEKKFKCIKIQTRQLDWGIFNDSQESAYETVINAEGQQERRFNIKLFKEAKLMRIIVGWNLCKSVNDRQVMPLEVKPEILEQLPIPIVEKILYEYDRQSILSEAELKKLKSRRMPTT